MKSKLCPPFGLVFGTNLIAVSVPTIPIGMFTRNIQCHDAASSTNPPMIGPAMMPIEAMAPLMPSALPRSEGGNASVVMAKPRAKIMAAPTPWKMRAPMRKPIVGEKAANSEPRVNTANPVVKIGFFPIMSPSRPKPSTSVVWVRK